MNDFIGFLSENVQNDQLDVAFVNKNDENSATKM